MGTKEDERLKERLLLEDGFPQNESSGLYTGDGSVDIKGQPVLKSNTGNWRACPFILGTECCERLAFFGIAINLVSYLTKTMHEGNVSAARNVSNWTGTAYLTPLIGAVLADVCWGRCLDKAAVITDIENKNGDFSNPWRLCTVTQVEELKILIRMFPIWATGIIICAVYAQLGTLFVEQGMMMDRTIGSFSIPAASLSACDIISVIFWVPVYDRVIVPIARKFTGREKGFTELQRMGIGLFISVLCMVSAALVEMKRLALAQALGLVDENVPIPLSITWQISQYFLFGAAEVFTFIGQLEFFYEQSPDGMRSLFAALSLLTTSMGSYLSSFILTVVTSITTEGGKAGWIPDNLNEGHLDHFFWLVAALSIVNLVVFVFCAKIYKPKKAS